MLAAENDGTEVITRDIDGAVFIRQDVAERVIERLRAEVVRLEEDVAFARRATGRLLGGANP